MVTVQSTTHCPLKSSSSVSGIFRKFTRAGVIDDDDTVFFAHCYPFTYSDQCNFINKVCTFQNKDKIRKTVLCKSLAGNDVDMLIVTNFMSDPVDIAVRKSMTPFITKDELLSPG